MVENKNVEQDFMVCIRVTGRVYVPAKALNTDMARGLADNAVSEMDFGSLEDIDWKAVYAEDKNDKRVYFE